ncbi:unnamed protein product [Closterium sp. Yama58-4]|nr:unnamed protein product [Closterium sp. Yama58-4]
MMELDAEGTILHSIRTKAVDFQTNIDSVREKAKASVAEIHLQNQKRIQAEFIASKALEVEEIAKAANSRITALATRMEDYIQGLSADPDLVVSDAAKEKFRLLKGFCIEKAQADIAAAKDELTIRELDRQRKKAAEDLKKAAASEEVQEMELEPALEEILAKQVKKIEDKLRKEITAKVEASLTKKLQKNLSLKEQDPAQATAANPKQKNTAGKQKSQENGNAAPAGSKPRRKRALGLGLKFIPTPTVSLSAGIELDQLFRQISLHFFFKDADGPLRDSRFHVRNPTWLPDRMVIPEQVFKDSSSDLSVLLKATQPDRRRNLSAGVRKALRTIAADRDVVIKPADKNVGITMMDWGHYIRLCMEHLGDSTTYSLLSHDPTADVYRKLRELHSVWGPALPETLWKYFFNQPPGGWKPAAFYILPKLHKKKLVGRPIAASHSWVTSNVSRWLDAELRPWVLQQQTYLRDSLSLLLKLEETAFPKGIFLATYDVTALYPSIPLQRGIDAVSSILQSGKYHNHLPVIALLEWVMMNSVVEFDGQLYLQRQGTAMGTSAAVCFAVLFMSRLDEVLKHRWFGTQPLCHVRYIDDGFIVWPGSRSELECYLSTFNGLDPNIKLTWHISDSSADFLDMVIFKGPRFAEKGNLDLKTFQKPMNSYLYLPFSSYHPRHCKVSFIRAELRRYLLRSTSAKAFLASKHEFFHRLRRRGYPGDFLLPIFRSVFFRNRPLLLETTAARQAHKLIPLPNADPWS